MRIAIGTMMHESNNLAAVPTTLADFRVMRGEELYSHKFWRSHPTGGIVSVLEQEGVFVIPTLFGRAMVSGTVERSAYDSMKEGIVDGVRRALPVDGVCLALHGSMYAEGVDDPEGDLLSAVREVVGHAVPIVCSLDMHATVTEQMVRSATAFTAYRTAPHTDAFQTGERAARLLLRILREKLDLVMEWMKMPMLLCGEQSETAVSPMKELVELVRQTELQPHIVTCDYLLGFPWSDTPHHGVFAIAVGERKESARIRESVESLAESLWSRRHDFTFTTEAYPLDGALDAALLDPRRPVIIADTGDNPTAGASENLTLVVQRLVERGIGQSLVAVIADARSRRACAEASEGAIVHLALGRLGVAPDAPPYRCEARVLKLAVAQENESAVVDISGVTVIITARRTAVYDPGFLGALGISAEDYKLIVVKSGYLSPEYQAIAARKLFALTPGETNIDMASIPYQVVPRPIYPLDRHMEWRP